MNDENKTIWYLCHGMYGCDCGCCGYRLCLDEDGFDDDLPVSTKNGHRFTFDHFGGDDTPDAFARRTWIVPDNIEIKLGKWWECL